MTSFLQTRSRRCGNILRMTAARIGAAMTCECPVSEIPSHNHWVVIRSPCLLDAEMEMARGPAVKIILGDSERSELEMRSRRRKIARVDAVRAEIVLLAADGMNNCAIAATLGVSRLTVGLWRSGLPKSASMALM